MMPLDLKRVLDVILALRLHPAMSLVVVHFFSEKHSK